MRRLDKLVQNTYLTLSVVEQDRASRSDRGASPVPPTDCEGQLPEWKFFNRVHNYAYAVYDCLSVCYPSLQHVCSVHDTVYNSPTFAGG